MEVQEGEKDCSALWPDLMCKSGGGGEWFVTYVPPFFAYFSS